MMRQRWVALAAIATFACLAGMLLLILRGSQLIAADGVTIDTGGRVALIGLLLAAIVPAFIRRVDIRMPRWLPIVAGAASFAVTAGLWALVALDKNSLAWAAYGGLQVLRAKVNFNDLDWDLRWLDCDLCSEWNPHYGPALAWANPLTGSTIGVGWVTALGFLMAAASIVALVWLMRRSSARGTIVLIVAAFGPAWLLQQDRANLDGLVFLTIVFGGWLVSKRNSLLSWSLFAALIWVNGALKYYPFAVGIALLPALRLRRGWMVLVGFLAASGVFMALYWTDFLDSLRWNGESILVTWDFPAYGRLMVLSRMGEFGDPSHWFSAGNLLFVLLALCAMAWGFAWGAGLKARTPVLPSMALGGGTVFLSAVLVGGFGFMYKGVFLLPLIPLLALPMREWRRHRAMTLYTSLFAIICATYAMTFAYASVLTTLAGILAACIGVGAGLSLTWKLFALDRQGQVQAHAAETQESIAAS